MYLRDCCSVLCVMIGGWSSLMEASHAREDRHSLSPRNFTRRTVSASALQGYCSLSERIAQQELRIVVLREELLKRDREVLALRREEFYNARRILLAKKRIDTLEDQRFFSESYNQIQWCDQSARIAQLEGAFACLLGGQLSSYLEKSVQGLEAQVEQDESEEEGNSVFFQYQIRRQSLTERVSLNPYKLLASAVQKDTKTSLGE